MYRGNLLSTLLAAGRLWSFYRGEGRDLRRWLMGGKVVLAPADSGEARQNNLGAMLLLAAIMAGADEVLIAPRRLTGLYEVESRPDFWTPDPTAALRAGLKAHEHRTPETWPEALTYFVRFTRFTRYDTYHGKSGMVTLVGGHEPDFFGSYVRVLEESFRRPWRLSIINKWPDAPAPAKACTVSRAQHVCGVDVCRDGIGLSFAYEN